MRASITLHIAPLRRPGWRYWLAEKVLPGLFDYRPVTVEFSKDDISYQVDEEFDITARTVITDGKITGGWQMI